MPDNANDWSQLLLSKALPSPFRLGTLVINSLDKNPSYRHVADQLGHDPVLSFYIMNEANRGRPKGNPTSKTLDHAISMIGTDELKRLIKGLPHKDSASTDMASFYYLRSLSSSLYAAHLGRAIATKKHVGNPDDIYWSSLLLGVPIWYLWYTATPEMRLVRYAIRSNFKPAQQAEQEVLNCTVREICEAMAEKMHLPDLSNRCYQPDARPSLRQWITLARAARPEAHPEQIKDRDLVMRLQQPEILIMLANLLAHYSTHDWYSIGCLRAQRILATYMKIPLAEAVQLTHEVAVNMSREHPIAGLMLPAAKLLLPPRLRQKAVEKSAADAPQKAPADTEKTASEPARPEQKTTDADATTEHPVDAPPKPVDLFVPAPMYRELTRLMQENAEEFSDTHELMNAAVQGIAYGLNISRATVALINRDNSRFKTYYSVGCREHPELASYESQIIRNTIFEKLVARPASVWIKPETDEKVSKLIPSNFKQVIYTEEFFLMSVFVGKKPVAIFYADNANAEPLLKAQYDHFKYMCGAATSALTHQARKKRAKS